MRSMKTEFFFKLNPANQIASDFDRSRIFRASPFRDIYMVAWIDAKGLPDVVAYSDENVHYHITRGNWIVVEA